MSRKERFARESHFTKSAKAMSIVFTVGVIALLMARAPLHLTDASEVLAPTAVERLFVQAEPFGVTLSAEESTAAARAAKQDDPPIASF